MKEMQKVVACRVGKRAEIMMLGSDLDSQKEFVGGHIEGACYFNDDVILICNEFGKVENFPFNRAIFDSEDNIRDYVAGNFFIQSMKDGGRADLTEEQAEKYMKMFLYPEILVKDDNGNIYVVPIDNEE